MAKTNGKRAEMLDFLRRNYPDSGSRVCEITLSAPCGAPLSYNSQISGLVPPVGLEPTL